jgi:hypothetical protein
MCVGKEDAGVVSRDYVVRYHTTYNTIDAREERAGRGREEKKTENKKTPTYLLRTYLRTLSVCEYYESGHTEIM